MLSEIDRMYPGLMVRFGGHSKACGLVIYEKDFLHFKNAFEEIAKDYPDEAFANTIRYDLELSFADITEKFIEDLYLLEPFGYGNETPRFLFRNIKLLEYRRVGDGKHLSMALVDGNFTMKGIWFDCPQDLPIPDTIDIVGYPFINSFNGSKEIQIRVAALLD
jgi:single-stranded-DNA-specific exonuclease